MERHQGSWKVEGEEEYNIGELVIDNDYIDKNMPIEQISEDMLHNMIF